mmetsp:Transcript_4774/g.21317  ORF Transcript_4774/g.21317 Transcript_4774/m.21317 type:complete len:346 (-) Transcript_4774:195-1232(-)
MRLPCLLAPYAESARPGPAREPAKVPLEQPLGALALPCAVETFAPTSHRSSQRRGGKLTESPAKHRAKALGVVHGLSPPRERRGLTPVHQPTRHTSKRALSAGLLGVISGREREFGRLVFGAEGVPLGSRRVELRLRRRQLLGERKDGLGERAILTELERGRLFQVPQALGLRAALLQQILGAISFSLGALEPRSDEFEIRARRPELRFQVPRPRLASLERGGAIVGDFPQTLVLLREPGAFRVALLALELEPVHRRARALAEFQRGRRLCLTRGKPAFEGLHLGGERLRPRLERRGVFRGVFQTPPERLQLFSRVVEIEPNSVPLRQNRGQLSLRRRGAVALRL